MNRGPRAVTSAALACLLAGEALAAGDRALVWRGNAKSGEKAPVEWTDGDATTFVALTPEAPDAVVRIGFEWGEPRPVAALEADFLSLYGDVFEPQTGAATLELRAADGWFPAEGQLERDVRGRAELAKFQEFGGVRWRVAFPRCEVLGVRLVLSRTRRDGAFASYVVRELSVADAPGQPKVALARGAVATALAGAPPAAPAAADESTRDLSRDPSTRRSHDGVGQILDWPRPRLVSEISLEARQAPSVEWWDGSGWRNVLVRGATTEAGARGGAESTLQFVPHAVTRLRFVNVDADTHVAVRLGARARDDFARARLAWGDLLQEQVAESIGEPDAADVASWLLPVECSAAVLGRPGDPVETLVTWNGTLHETEHGDEGPWDSGAATAVGSRARWTDRFVAFALDGELFGADPDATTRELFDGGRPGVTTRCDHDGVVAEVRAFVTAKGDVAWGTLATVVLENQGSAKRGVAFDAILGRRAAIGDVLTRAPRRCRFTRDGDPRVLRMSDGGEGDGEVALFATPPGTMEPAAPDSRGDYETCVHWSFDLAPDESRELTLFVPSVNEPLRDAARLAKLDPVASRQRFDRFWDDLASGCAVELPEAPLTDLVKQLLAQCRIVLFDERPAAGGSPSLTLKYGAYVYEDYFGLEEGWPTLALAEFGQIDAARAAAVRMLAPDVTDPANYHHPYRIGLALTRAAEIARLAPDVKGGADFVKQITPRLDALTRWIVTARHQDDESGGEFAGLLPKHAYGGDVATPARSLYANAACWRGLHEVARLRDDAGLASEAAAMRARIGMAVEQFADRSSDPPFVPMAVDYGETGSDAWKRAEEPYPFLAADPIGNYWSLFAPLLLETGVFAPKSLPATWIEKTLEQHGGQILGLARFHAAVDPIYGFGAIEQLSGMNDGAAFRTAAYSFLTNALARDVYTGGEVEGVFPLRVSNVAARARLDDTRWNFGVYSSDATVDDFGRAVGAEPLSASAGVALLLIRRMLVEELPAVTDAASEKAPRELHLLRLAPPRWFANRRKLRLRQLPTEFGPVTLSLESHIEDGAIRGSLEPPAGERRPARIVLWLNHPDGEVIRAATFAGEPALEVHEDHVVLPADRAGDFEVRF